MESLIWGYTVDIFEMMINGNHITELETKQNSLLKWKSGTICFAFYMDCIFFAIIKFEKKILPERKKYSPAWIDLPIVENILFWVLQKTIHSHPHPWLNAIERHKHLRNLDFCHIVRKIMKQILGTCHCKLETDKCLEIKRALIHLCYSVLTTLIHQFPKALERYSH